MSVMPFAELTQRGQARRLRTLAREALAAYGLADAHLRLLSNEWNCTFRVDAPSGRYALRIELDLEDVPALASLPLKIALYRALQETLSNATRHGRSERISVRLSGTTATLAPGHRGLELIVSDAGGGFDPALLDSSVGLGLAGIREQAEILGGTFTLSSAAGQGTEVRVWWPLVEPEEDA